MRAVRMTGVVVAFALLVAGTVMVFAAFDSHSHSVSDTVRPFVITMAPAWAVMIAGAWVLLRSPSRSRGA